MKNAEKRPVLMNPISNILIQMLKHVAELVDGVRHIYEQLSNTRPPVSMGDARRLLENAFWSICGVYYDQASSSAQARGLDTAGIGEVVGNPRRAEGVAAYCGFNAGVRSTAAGHAQASSRSIGPPKSRPILPIAERNNGPLRIDSSGLSDHCSGSRVPRH